MSIIRGFGLQRSALSHAPLIDRNGYGIRLCGVKSAERLHKLNIVQIESCYTSKNEVFQRLNLQSRYGASYLTLNELAFEFPRGNGYVKLDVSKLWDNLGKDNFQLAREVAHILR